MTARTGGLDELRGEALHPSVDADVIDGDAALGQEFPGISAGQSVAQIPADPRTEITSRGNRKPGNPEDEPDDVTVPASAFSQRNRPC